MTDCRAVPHYVSVGKLEPEGAYCLTLDKHGVIIMQHVDEEIVQHIADLINADYDALNTERQRLEAELASLHESKEPHGQP